MKDMHCRDTGMSCYFVARGETAEDVREAMTEHAFNAHGLKATPELETAIDSLIHDEGSEAHAKSIARPDEHVSSP